MFKAVRGEDVQKVLDKVCDFYGNDFDRDRLALHLKILSVNFPRHPGYVYVISTRTYLVCPQTSANWWAKLSLFSSCSCLGPSFNKCGQRTHLQCNEAVEDLPQNEAGSPEPLATSACSQRTHRWPALHSDGKIFRWWLWALSHRVRPLWFLSNLLIFAFLFFYKYIYIYINFSLSHSDAFSSCPLTISLSLSLSWSLPFSLLFLLFISVLHHHCWNLAFFALQAQGHTFH